LPISAAYDILNGHHQLTRAHTLSEVRSSFAGAEKRSGNEKPAGNTLCIGKGFEAAWAFFCPSKPCVSLLIDGKKRGKNL